MRKFVVFVCVIMAFGILVPAHAQDSPFRAFPAAGKLFESRLSPDGRTLAIFENGQLQDFAIDEHLLPIRLFDLATGDETLLNAEDYAMDVVWSADSTQLISYHGAGWLIVWDAVSGMELKRWQAPPNGMRLAILPDGSHLAASFPGTTSQFGLWDLTSGAIVSYFTVPYTTYIEFQTVMNEVIPSEFPVAITVSSDGSTLYEATSWSNIRQWDLATGQMALVFDDPEDQVTLSVRMLTLSPDGSMLIYYHTMQKMLYAVDIATGNRTALREIDARTGVGVSADGSRVAWVEDQVDFMVWDWTQPDSEPRLLTLSDPGTDMPGGSDVQVGRGYRTPPIFFTPDNTQLVLAGFSALESGENVILVIDLE